MTTDTATMTGPVGHGADHDAPGLHALGFWLYLMTDLIVFSALFATYVVLAPNTAGGPSARELFHLPEVFVETMLLLTSSVVFGYASLALGAGKKGLGLAGLVLTFLLGLGFIVMELGEFSRLILAGAGPQRSGFLSAFFTLVGTHGAHVAVGLLWLVVMMGQILTKGLTVPVRSRLARLGMFWHFLDIIWIGLFTVVYLMGVMS